MFLLLVCAFWLAPLQSELKAWVDGPVSIVLSEVEKKTFTQLSTDEERQRFIDGFWASRDASRAAGIN